jgi:hypothetical protein
MAEAGAASFQAIGGLSYASGISPNGIFVIGGEGKWSSQGGLVNLKGGGDWSISNDGRIAAGYFFVPTEGGGEEGAAVDFEGHRYQSLGQAGYYQVSGMSGDGRTLVGSSTFLNGASVWHLTAPDAPPLLPYEGPVYPELPTPPGTFLGGSSLGTQYGGAYDITEDGSTILVSGSHLLVNGTDIGRPSNLPLTHIGTKLSANGRFIAGDLRSPAPDGSGHLLSDGGFVYDRDRQQKISFPTLGTTGSDVNAVSSNGRLVGTVFNVGQSGSSRAFYWDDGLTAAIDMKDYLLNQPRLAQSLAGWTLTSANDISADGRTIIGSGINPQGQQQAWIADLTKHVVLNFGQAAPGAIVAQPTQKNPDNFYYDRNGTGLGSLPVGAQDQTRLVADVQAIFDRSGIKNIEVTTTPAPDAVNVFFSATDTPSRSIDGASLSEYVSPVTGLNVLGINRHAATSSGNVLVFPAAFTRNAPPHDYGGLEYVAETIAHEVGHALGLMHVDSDGRSGAVEVMDYDATKNDAERFLNAVTPIVGYPNGVLTQTGVTSNPVFGLRRFVDGLPDSALASAQLPILPGDLEGFSPLTVGATVYKVSAGDEPLYDVQMLLGGSLVGESLFVPHQVVPISSVSQISTLLKSLPLGLSFELFAASAPGGPLNIAIATMDINGSEQFEIPLTGHSIHFVLNKYDVDGSITTLATGQLGNVPEPSSMMLALAPLCASVLARRRTRHKRASPIVAPQCYSFTSYIADRVVEN